MTDESILVIIWWDDSHSDQVLFRRNVVLCGLGNQKSYDDCIWTLLPLSTGMCMSCA